MKNEKENKKPIDSKDANESKSFKPGDQFAYPPSEDIYNNAEEVQDIDVDDTTKRKPRNEPEGAMNEKSFKDDVTGSDLDVPGSELDDVEEKAGREDEENNSYSLGGDNHDD